MARLSEWSLEGGQGDEQSKERVHGAEGAEEDRRAHLPASEPADDVLACGQLRDAERGQHEAQHQDHDVDDAHEISFNAASSLPCWSRGPPGIRIRPATGARPQMA